MLFSGLPYTVTHVRVTNRGDPCCIDRAWNMRVGVTNDAPDEGIDIQPGSYTLCDQKSGGEMMLSITFQ